MKTFKRNIMKRFLICLLIIFALVAATACGGGGGDVYDGDKLVLKLVGHALYPLQPASRTEDSEDIIKIIEDKLKIKLDVSTAPFTTYMDMLSPMIATGQTPDFFIHFKYTESFSSWVEDGLLMDFEPYLKTGNYPNLARQIKMLSTDENEIKSYLGGSYYSYPIVLHTNQEPGELSVELAMYYRRDWYNALKNKNWTPSSGRALVDPQDANFNYLNFYDLCEGFTKGDPDGNGKDDTYGYGFTKDEGVHWWFPILNMFGVNYDGWYKDGSGNWKPECITDTMKEAVMFIADMYDNGFINEQYSTTTTFEMMKNDFCNGKSGIITFNTNADVTAGMADMMDAYVGQLPDGKEGGGSTENVGQVIMGMPVVTGKYPLYGTSLTEKKHILGAKNNYGYIAINNDISETKKLKILELLEYLLSEEGDTLLTWGIEGRHWEYADDGVTKKSLLPVEGTGHKRQQYLLYNNTIAPATYRLKGLVSWHTVDTNDPRPYPEAVDQIRAAWDKKYLFIDELTFVSVPATFATVQTKLENKTATAFKNIVSKRNATEREAIWQEYVRYFNEQGADYINEKNQAAKALGK